ncbi:putative manganese transporter, partial [Myxococcota bacterium]|nr:putative manganese transporter [Myxococcota bacterium]
LLAGLIGFIPDSGPHLLFVMLFFQGVIPFSVLAASSISQDGHGAIPLLAHSRKDFFFVKGINLGVGLLVGAVLLLLGT